MPNTSRSPREASPNWKRRIQTLKRRIGTLKGDPHYVAMGMAVGIFVAFTPTIPFHTFLTIVLAIVFKGSKAAALIGSWLNNPFTFPVFYYGSYKVGTFLLGHDIPQHIRYNDIKMLMTLGMDVAVAMIAGGALMGILPAVAAYFATRYVLRNMRARHPADPSASSDPSDRTSGPCAHDDVSEGAMENREK